MIEPWAKRKEGGGQALRTFLILAPTGGEELSNGFRPVRGIRPGLAWQEKKRACILRVPRKNQSLPLPSLADGRG